MFRHWLVIVAAVCAIAVPAEAANSKGHPALTLSAVSAPQDLKALDNAELMRRARALQADLEYDEVLPLVREVLSREPPVDIALDAYVLEGSCLAIVGDAVEAEQPFRRLLRGRPDFDLPADTPPKIMAVFRKVQVEERAIVDQLKQLERARLVAAMALTGLHPSIVTGGRAIHFNYELRDPSLSASMRVQYRRTGEPAFSTLALIRDAAGHWRGQIPGDWTANDGGARMELYVETFDSTGPLLTVGSAAEPLVATLGPGQVDRSIPPPLAPWVVFVGGGATVALALGGGGFGLGMVAVQQQYDAQGALAVTEAQPGAELREKRELGEALSYAANGLFIASGVLALSTVVAGAFFTDWEGRVALEEEGDPNARAAGR